MIKISFANAQVRDGGYGLHVNGERLEDIISMALGTKAKDINYGDPRYEKLKSFEANSCDVTVVISPHPQEVMIEDDNNRYCSLEELEESINERITEETTEAES